MKDSRANEQKSWNQEAKLATSYPLLSDADKKI